MIDKKYFQDILDDIKQSGLWKEERIITTPQSACIDTTKADGVVIMRSSFQSPLFFISFNIS